MMAPKVACRYVFLYSARRTRLASAPRLSSMTSLSPSRSDSSLRSEISSTFPFRVRVTICSMILDFDVAYGISVTTSWDFPPRRASFTTRALMITRPRPSRYMSRIPSRPTMKPPVGKSGPGRWRIRSSTVQSGSMASCFTAAATSRRLCGGTLVLIPTAIPELPFTRRPGMRPGRTTGSCSRPSKLSEKSTVSWSMSSRRLSATLASRASV